MKKLFTFFVIGLALSLHVLAQVKPQYIYSTTMPYGTLDLRTTISSTYYYYLQEGKTFAYRESSPGVRTNSYVDMTTFDSSPYQQGNLRLKNGTSDKFVMNYRLLMPLNYNAAYAEGYPMIVLMHGAGERANCFYNACYHGTWSYDPNVNSPAAPKDPAHRLLNNDHNVSIGGKQHIDARNLAAGKLPNDPSMPARAFPGFVVIPQMLNDWDSLSVQNMIRIVQLVAKKYKVDQNKIYIHGLSIGGVGVYQAIKRASWLFAAALPMSAPRDGYIFKHNQQGKVVHIPLWVFQGGTDKNPTPATTQTLVNKFNSAGAVVRYSYYSTYSHAVWNKAYSEPDFFSWMLKKTKSNIHPSKGIVVIDRSKNQYPKLMLAEGFFVYQWEKNGVIISGASSNIYTATTTGTYRARFSRVAAPTATQWNKWSAPVTITEVTGTMTAAATETPESIEAVMSDEIFTADVYPNPTSSGNLNVSVSTVGDAPVQIEIIDGLGRIHYNETQDLTDFEDGVEMKLPISLVQGMYIVVIKQGRRQMKKRVLIKN